MPWLGCLLLAVGGGVVLMVLVISLIIYFGPICDGDSGTGRSRADVKTLEINVIRYRTMSNNYPESLEDFVRKPENYPGNWRPLMPESALKDPLGEPYQYRNPGLKNPDGYDVFSKGIDKTEGTEDDIGNWQ